MVASKHLTPLPPFEHETSEPTVWIVEEPLATIPIAAATGISASSNSSRAVESPHGPFATLEVLERLGALSSSKLLLASCPPLLPPLPRSSSAAHRHGHDAHLDLGSDRDLDRDLDLDRDHDRESVSET
eukprot:CAMPEP_0184394202 /NCGR_PEP_ID=MMETSP0007-20130409/39124_1 /TAXON_ID=97485 /ORGANISM="Prymnesium parvum, Strain Texoma1" /LENGTH=128 /DNA_ID=CAMNT_0026745667 /DNA_START=387 /DNA_END=775 /DNA_ORIENTATION=-